MYEGLQITTNKIPVEETNGIPHHLLGFVRLEEAPWTVRQFHKRATSLIDEIRSRGRLPILVGGTHYYTQSLLFKDSLVEVNESDSLPREEQEQTWPILDASTGDMLQELQRVDPVMAQRWHPRDRRKIRRSLEIWLKTGKKASDFYEAQRERRPTNGSREGSELLEGSSVGNDVLVLWTNASADVLNSRLDKRVDNMISEGLLKEVESMYEFVHNQERQGITIDRTRGIWVAIGFKEFQPYFSSQSASEEWKKVGIERTKIATRQYAKRQTRWIRLKLLRAMQESGLGQYMFPLDATDLSQWPRRVEERAVDITEAFLHGQAIPPETAPEAANGLLVSEQTQDRCARYCEACDKTLMSDTEWVGHLKSKGHRSAIRPKIDWRALYPKDEVK